MQALFLLSPSFFFSQAVRPQIHHRREGTIPQKLAVNSDPAADEEPELSLSITLPRYQNAAIIMQLQMKEKNKPAVCSDGRACRLERSLCHTYQLRDISWQKTPGSDAYLHIPAPVQTCKSPRKSICHLPAGMLKNVLNSSRRTAIPRNLLIYKFRILSFCQIHHLMLSRHNKAFIFICFVLR